MGKNSQVHFYIESDEYEAIKQEATKQGLAISSYCRLKVLEGSRLARIEQELNRLGKIIGDLASHGN